MRTLSRRQLASLLFALIAALLAASACSSDDSPPSDAGPDGSDSGGDAGPVPAHCNPLNPRHCALPWPSSFYLKEDSTTKTGFRLNYSAESLPISKKGVKLDPTRYNLLDGFSPSSQPLAYFEGGVSEDGLPAESDDYAKSKEPTSLVQIIDFTTGERVPLFAEAEQNAQRPGFSDVYKSGLMIRPMVRLEENRRYVVVLRVGIKDQAGKALEPPEAFRKIRDGVTTGDPTIDNEGARLEPVLSFVEGKGIKRSEMLLVWDFHTASGDAIRGNLQGIVDDALARVAKLADGPAFKVTQSVANLHPKTLREVKGTISVPSYLASDDPKAIFKLDSDGKPVYRAMQDFAFKLHIPKCAETATPPLPVMVYGHGFFGTADEEMSSVHPRDIANRLCMVQVGVDWIGVTKPDQVPIVTEVLADFSKFPFVTDRLQQAQVNFAVLVELIAKAKIFSDPQMLVGGNPISDGKEIYYYGVSNGGIQGTALAALQTRIRRFVLQVAGGTWTLLAQRSSFFAPLIGLLLTDYGDPMNVALLFHSTQTLWDAVDPASWGAQILSKPLPGRPSDKVVLLQEAKYDPSVSNLGTRLLVRSIGLPLMTPRHEAVFGVEEKAGPLDSAYVQWNLGTKWRPLKGNLSPSAPDSKVIIDSNGVPQGESSHHLLRHTESNKLQLERFFKPGGKVEHTCTGPCTIDNAITP